MPRSRLGFPPDWLEFTSHCRLIGRACATDGGFVKKSTLSPESIDVPAEHRSMHEKEREKEEGRRRGGEGKRGGEKKRERNACGNFSLFPPPHPLASSCPYFSYKHGTTRFHFDLTLSNSFVPLAQNSSFEHPTTRREQSEGKLSLVSSFVLPLPTLFLSALRGLDDSFFLLLLPFLPSFPTPSLLSKFLSNSLISLNGSAHFVRKCILL